MPDLLTTDDWARFNEAINDAGDTFNKIIITWRRYNYFINEFNEDPTPNVTDISLNVLFSDNYFHSWPITLHSATGELDRENCAIFINMDYLNGLGYINARGNFNFMPDMDRFIHNGIVYKCEGWTPVAPSDVAGTGKHLMIMIILKREEVPTGTNQLNA